jgi:hypothetical protein
MAYLGRAVAAPPRRDPLLLPARATVPTPYGPSCLPDPDSALSPWSFEKPGRTLPPLPAVGSTSLLPLPVQDRLLVPPNPRPLSRRSHRASYDALESHGHFELTDTGETTGGSRAIALHLPRRSRAFVLDPRVGDVIHANSARGARAVGGALDVTFVTRHK